MCPSATLMDLCCAPKPPLASCAEIMQAAGELCEGSSLRTPCLRYFRVFNAKLSRQQRRLAVRLLQAVPCKVLASRQYSSRT